MGLEPTTFTLQGYCAPNCATAPYLCKIYIKAAEHPIESLASCGTSIVYLLAEFEPLTMAAILLLLIKRLSESTCNFYTLSVLYSPGRLRLTSLCIYGCPGGARTHNPAVNSRVLYRLSYRAICKVDSGAHTIHSIKVCQTTSPSPFRPSYRRYSRFRLRINETFFSYANKPFCELS